MRPTDSRTTRTAAALMLVALVAPVNACTPAPSTGSPDREPATPAATATRTGPTSTATAQRVVLPVDVRPSGTAGFMAPGEGTLDTLGNCVVFRLRGLGPVKNSPVVVWPQGYYGLRGPRGITVYTDKDQEAARPGEYVTMVGGYVNPTENMREPHPCVPPSTQSIWLAYAGVDPRPPSTSTH